MKISENILFYRNIYLHLKQHTDIRRNEKCKHTSTATHCLDLGVRTYPCASTFDRDEKERISRYDRLLSIVFLVIVVFIVILFFFVLVFVFAELLK